MRICFSVLHDGQLAPHFGESGRYVVYDTESATLSEHTTSALPCRGPCRCYVPELAGIDLVICRTIGHLVLRALKAQGAPVYQTQETDMLLAIAAWQAEQLPVMGRAICKTGRRPAARRPLIHKEN